MLERLGHVTVRRRRAVLSAAAVFVLVALAWGTGVFGRLTGGGFEDPGSESTRAAALAEQALGRDAVDAVVVYRAAVGGPTVDQPAYRDTVVGLLDRLPDDAVVAATSYWSTGGAPALVADDGRTTYVALRLAGVDDAGREAAYERIADDLVAPAASGLETLRGGPVPTSLAVNDQVSADIARAESLSIPVLLVLLVVVFGGLAAASLPLAIGGLAVLGAFTALRVISLATDVSVFAVNIVTMLGLGLAIDYALFVVSRFREELAAGHDTERAVVRTMVTAGRTVLFSGLTVALALSAMLLFPLGFLRSMGFGGVAAVLVAMVGSLTVLPAILAVLGERVNALRVPLPGAARRRQSEVQAPDRGAWHAIASAVMRRPVLVVAGLTVVLVAMGTPFLRVAFGSPDARVLPVGTEERVAAEVLERSFPGSATRPIDVVVRLAGPAADAGPELQGYADRLAAVPGVTSVAAAGLAGDTARLSLTYAPDPVSERARALVDTVRAVPGPAGSDVAVGGLTAANADTLAAIGRTLPWALLWVVGGMLLLLFLAFGSVVLPIKAVLMNVLSLGAAFGAVVWIFQDGYGSGLLGFTSVGSVEASQPVLMFAIAFGLAMDYEVFLLSRIREEWLRTGDNAQAVAVGLQRTGRIITSAALLLVVVIGAFATSGVTFIKMIGVGVAIAIVVDATVVRALLVPATMRLLGRWNWWAPAPLARLHARVGIDEAQPEPRDGRRAVAGGRPDPAYATMNG